MPESTEKGNTSRYGSSSSSRCSSSSSSSSSSLSSSSSSSSSSSRSSKIVVKSRKASRSESPVHKKAVKQPSKKNGKVPKPVAKAIPKLAKKKSDVTKSKSAVKRKESIKSSSDESDKTSVEICDSSRSASPKRRPSKKASVSKSKKKTPSESKETLKSKKKAVKSRATPVQPVKKKKFVHLYGEVAKVEVCTPSNVMDFLHEEFGTELFDPCPLIRMDEADGLNRTWGKLNYINPPFKDAQRWMDKALQECLARGSTSILFIPARTGSRYYQSLVYTRADEVRWVTGSIRFPSYERNAPFPMMMVIYRPGPRAEGIVRDEEGYEIDPAPKIVCDMVLDQQLVESAAVKRRLPLLWFIAKHCSAIARPKQKEFIAWRAKWCSRRFSPDRLFQKVFSDPKSTKNTVYFSLFLQLCEVESRQFGDRYGESIPSEKYCEHPTFFRMLCGLRKKMAPYAEGFRKMARVPDLTPNDPRDLIVAVKENPWLIKACHFYIVYREYRENEWRRAVRFRYSTDSLDAKFSVDVQFQK